ncbi:Antifungal protein ginkbilobin-like protein 1 [Linum grandiflorum]
MVSGVLLITITIMILTPSFHVAGKREWANTTLVHRSCTKHTIHNSRYLSNVVVLLRHVAKRTSTKHHYDYHVSSPTTPTVYGHANCSRSLVPRSCGRCLEVAEREMLKVCKLRVGGVLELSDCRIRYNNVVFSDH